MDPVSAAGIGLGVASLVFTVFSGCVKGYQIFVEADDMPESYQHLRVRLRIEQTRLLQWGEKVGLLHDTLEVPSMIIQLRRNLILDVLLEMQALFRDCVKITAPLDQIVDVKPLMDVDKDKSFAKRFPKGTNHILAKVLSAVEKTPQAPRRLKWATITQDKFEQLVEKLIKLNNAMEGFLDRADMNELHMMQHQTLMAILQLNGKVEELTQISRALRISGDTSGSESVASGSALQKAEVQSVQKSSEFAQLAFFKAHQIQVETSKQVIEPVELKEIQLDAAAPAGTARSMGQLKEMRVWIEWKEIDTDFGPQWDEMIKSRLQMLVELLSTNEKPESFRAPKAIGFIGDEDPDIDRYGVIYKLTADPTQKSLRPFSLLELFSCLEKPCLTDRIELARKIAESLMYLHSVNWLHKGFRSDNILFFGTSHNDVDITRPVIAGFEYARPDIPDAMTEPIRRNTPNDVYRHPDQLQGHSVRSRKAFDIYSLGIILVEIAFWQKVDAVLGMKPDVQRTKAALMKVRENLLSEERLTRLAANMGRRYRDASQRCLQGNAELDVRRVSESDPVIGVEMQLWFSTAVVSELQAIVM